MQQKDENETEDINKKQERNIQNFAKGYWEDQYYGQSKSIQVIAAENGTYTNKIRRMFISLGIPFKSKEEAQRDALLSGRHKHPTIGQERPESIKRRIGESVSKSWNDLNSTEKTKRSECSKQQWANMTKEKKQELQSLAAKAVRRTSVEGSKIEIYMLMRLKSDGIHAEFHKEDLLINEKMQLDIYLPDLMTAIEIDGPTHFLPIWGEENLQKHQQADQEKTALLTGGGYNIIRVKHLAKNISEVYLNKMYAKVLAVIKYIETNRPLEIEKRSFLVEE